MYNVRQLPTDASCTCTVDPSPGKATWPWDMFSGVVLAPCRGVSLWQSWWGRRMWGYFPRVPLDHQTIPFLCPAVYPRRLISVDLFTQTSGLWRHQPETGGRGGREARGFLPQSLLASPQFCRGCLLEGPSSGSPSSTAPALSPGLAASFPPLCPSA